jgi:hypothetical protein
LGCGLEKHHRIRFFQCGCGISIDQGI